jgi:hypothetical protein
MPFGLIARLRLHRRPAVMIAAGLIAVQALLAGFGIAQAALILTPGVADFAVICHGGGGADSLGTAPDVPDRHSCCASCTAAAPATLPGPLLVLRAHRGHVVEAPSLRAVSILIAPRAVRAGFSQAPPSLA